MATAPKRPAKLTNEQVARQLTDLILDHMDEAGFSAEEQERRIDAFSRDVAVIRARAKSAKSSGSAAKRK